MSQKCGLRPLAVMPGASDADERGNATSATGSPQQEARGAEPPRSSVPDHCRCLVLTTPRQTYASQPPIGIRSFLQPRGGQRGAPTTSTRHFSRKRDAEQWLASQEVAIAHGERVDPAVSKM